MTPGVSIVLPVHNGAAYVRDAIESCLAQTYEDLELVLVDDASTDETPAVLAEYEQRDRRVVVVPLTENRRLPGALNAGFGRSSGRYLTWMSDDNRYRPQAIERMAAVLETRPDVDLVYSSYTITDEQWHALEPGDVRDFRLLIHWNVVGPCFLYRRTLYEQVGDYSSDAVLAEDYDYWLRASARHTLFWLDDDLYEYRRHDQSLTGTEGQRVIDAAQVVLARNLPRLRWASAGDRVRAYVRLARHASIPSRRRAYVLRGLREAFRPPFRTAR
jgi:glycosyltransferase involved in cell wall biosynthesis